MNILDILRETPNQYVRGLDIASRLNISPNDPNFIDNIVYLCEEGYIKSNKTNNGIYLTWEERIIPNDSAYIIIS